MAQVKPIPEGFRTVTPALVVKGADEAIQFYQEAFGAELILRVNGPHDSVVHAEIKVGDSMIMLSEEWPGHHIQSPTQVKGTTSSVHLYVNDVDAAHRRAVSAGAKEIMPPADMFWGDRFSSVVDPYGHSWSMATHIQDLTEEECQKACDAWMAEMGGGS